ncbi:MAG: RNA polymerase sigma factor [Lewinella sp.]|jgi:RNA polymerase sigma-70 factor (ECF subfamily)|uniref:RNA polymerase sigma factor n=2 Tax=Lewinella TaxID=70994 RepID=UPI003D6B0FA3
MKSNKATLDYVNTHREIIQECQHGNRQAQFELYKHYNRAMFNVCLRMLGNEHDAEDILQVSFVQIFKKIDTFRFESAIGAWIKRIVVNNCINFHKKRKLQFSEWDAKIDPVDESSEPPVPDGLKVQQIKQAMTQLSDGYRTVFSLYAIEGYDHQEIANILGISEATSKSQYCRARKRLKEILQTQKID